jgi:hypothetical protein
MGEALISSGTLALSPPVDTSSATPNGPSGATVSLQVKEQSGIRERIRDARHFFWPLVASSTASSGRVTTRDYVITLNRIEELRGEDDEDDRPSEYAYNIALGLLRAAVQELDADFPRASVSVGPWRGLRITWSCGSREIRLICGGAPTNRTYIYYESAGGHAIDNASGRRLADHLRWMLLDL